MKNDSEKPLLKLPGSDPEFLRRFEVKSIDPAGRFTGYAAVWNEKDQREDICIRGCFAKTLTDWAARGTLPRVKWQHMDTVGHCESLSEDDYGLLVSGVLWDKDVAEQLRRAMEQADDPAVAAGGGVGMSFAYYANDFEIRQGVRALLAVELLDDITLTMRPVCTSAAVTEIKSGDSSSENSLSVRQVERTLRDAGLSGREAKRLLSHGWNSPRDAGLLSALGELQGNLARI